MTGLWPCNALCTTPGCACALRMVVWTLPMFLSFVRAVQFSVSRDSLLAVALSKWSHRRKPARS